MVRADSRGSLILDYSVFVNEDEPIRDACGMCIQRHPAADVLCFRLHSVKSCVAGAGRISVRAANKLVLQEAAQLGRATIPVDGLAPGIDLHDSTF